MTRAETNLADREEFRWALIARGTSLQAREVARRTWRRGLGRSVFGAAGGVHIKEIDREGQADEPE